MCSCAFGLLALRSFHELFSQIEIFVIYTVTGADDQAF